MTDDPTLPPGLTVRGYYRQQARRLFQPSPPDPELSAQCAALRGRYRRLALVLVEDLPPCPELWHAVHELHHSLMLAETAMAANWATLVRERRASSDV